MSFPSSVPSYAGFTSSHTLSQDNHAAQHNSEQVDVVAIATKVGTGASTPTSGTVLRGNGTGTTAYDQVHLASDVSGILPAGSGGTGIGSLGSGISTFLGSPSSSSLSSAIADGTGSGSAVFSSSPTINSPTITSATLNSSTLNAPTIADFSNADHNHTNSAGGGVLSGSAVPNLSLSLQSLSNPYKFSAYKSSGAGNQTINTGAETQITFDTEDFDTNNNFASSTYTAPVAGFYCFMAALGYGSTASQTRLIATLLVNGTDYKRSEDRNTAALSGTANLNTFIKLSAGDTVSIGGTPVGANTAILGAQLNTWFQGYLVSQT